MQIDQIIELTRVAYNNTGEKYHQYFKDEMSQKAYDRNLLDKFSNLLPKDSLICDAGCGPSGHIGKYLFDKGHRVIGIDISQKCIEIAKDYNPSMDFRVMNMMNTTFASDSFDGIISFYSIIYTPKQHIDKIFAEFRRILKPNGKLVLVVKKGESEGIIDDEWYENNKVHFTHFVEEEIKGYLNNHKFRLDYFDTRKPYDFEYQIDRIYAIGTKLG